VGGQPPWCPPLVELADGTIGHLLCWEQHERDGSWWAWVSWVRASGSRPVHKIVSVRADSLAPIEAPDAYLDVPRRLRRADGSISQLRPA
jgi:hypothetical protein